MAKNDGDMLAAEVPKKRTRKRPPKQHAGRKLLAFLAESFPHVTKLLDLSREWARRKPVWVQVPVYLVLLVGLVAYAFRDSVVNLPVVRGIRGDVTAYVEDLFATSLPRASGKQFAIAVGRIEEDDNDNIAKSVSDALRNLGAERLQVYRRLRFVDAAKPDAAEAAAHETARRWLDKMEADLFIWGQVLKGDSPPTVRIIITSRNARESHEAKPAKSYLALNFVEATSDAFEAAIKAQVLGFLAQFDLSRAVATQLRDAITRLATIVRKRKDTEGRSALVFALANAEVMLGEQAADKDVLIEAIGTFQELVSARAHQKAPVEWAMAQNNLANALWSLGKLEGGVEKWEQAVAAYRAALQEYDPAKAALEWATTQNNLGLVLDSIGRRAGDTARLNEAVAVYREGLDKIDRERNPLDWAMVQNNLGNTLVALGERENDRARLMSAVEAFRAALTIRTRSKAPLSWAMTQSNLGNALGILGEREAGPARLEQAVGAYRQALKEYTVKKLPLDWAMTQNNLGTALNRWGEREKGTGHLRESVAAFHAALEKRDRKTYPVEWATTENNLGSALRTLGQREKSTQRLEESLAAHRAALEVIVRDRMPLEWAMTYNNIGLTLRELGELQKDTRRIGESIQMFEEALRVPELKSVPSYRLMVTNNLLKTEELEGTLANASGPSGAGR